MTTIDRIILGLLAGGVWALVAQLAVSPAVATTQVTEMPLQSVFNQYLATALSQAKSTANSCKIKGEIHGAQLDAHIVC